MMVSIVHDNYLMTKCLLCWFKLLSCHDTVSLPAANDVSGNSFAAEEREMHRINMHSNKHVRIKHVCLVNRCRYKCLCLRRPAWTLGLGEACVRILPVLNTPSPCVF